MLVLAGTYLSLSRLPQLSDLWTTSYGHALIAKISIVCVALMTLYEEGRVRLLDPVSRFLPAFGTVRVLLPSACSKASNTWGRRSGAMPMPVSRTSNTA